MEEQRFDERHRISIIENDNGVAMWVDGKLVFDASLFKKHGHFCVYSGGMEKKGSEFIELYSYPKEHKCNCEYCEKE